MKPLILLKIFPYLLDFPSTSSNLVTCFALYKDDQATYQGDPSLSLNILKLRFAAYISKLFHTSPSPLQKYLFLDNTITLQLLHHTITHSISPTL